MFRIFLLLLVSLLLGGCPDPRDVLRDWEPKIRAHRDYAYHIGEVMSLTYELPHEGGKVDPLSFPHNTTLNDGLILRDVRIEDHAQGDRDIRRLTLDFQVFKGVREPETQSVPPLAFKVLGDPSRTHHTPPWSFTLAPVIPPELKDEEIIPQPGFEPIKLDLGMERKRLIACSLFFALVLGLLMLRLILQKGRPRPFKACESRIRKGLLQDADQKATLDAYRALHLAFNQTYGATLFRSDLESFFARFPRFRGVETQLHRFLTLSSAAFFDPEGLSSLSGDERRIVLSLLANCIRAERVSGQ